jgi:hypothetical protein
MVNEKMRPKKRGKKSRGTLLSLKILLDITFAGFIHLLTKKAIKTSPITLDTNFAKKVDDNHSTVK